MKKLLNLLLALFLGFGMVQGINANERGEEHEVLKEQEELPKNYVFTDAELQGTEYEGCEVEVRDGVLYVDGRSVTSVLIWIYYNAHYVLAAYLAAGGTVTYTQNYPPGLASWAIQTVRNAWNSYQNMTEVYLNSNQTINNFRLSNGNQCVPTGSTYACMYSLGNEDEVSPHNNGKGEQ